MAVELARRQPIQVSFEQLQEPHSRATQQPDKTWICNIDGAQILNRVVSSPIWDGPGICSGGGRNESSIVAFCPAEAKWLQPKDREWIERQIKEKGRIAPRQDY